MRFDVLNVDPLAGVTTLAFDMFGTVLDLAGSLVPPAGRFLAARSAPLDGAASGISGGRGSVSSSSRMPS